MPTPPTDRILGLDLARFVAIVGMMATHVWLSSDLLNGEKVWISEQFEGRASALFAVLAGVGAVLATRRAVASARPATARWMLLGRGLALVVIGLTVGLLANPILVILAYYGVLFWLLALVVTWPRWALAVAAGVLVVLGPVACWAVGGLTGATDAAPTNPSWLSFADPLALLRQLLFTGTYPAAAWVVYGLVGLLVGRALLVARSAVLLRRLCLRLVGLGAAIWLAGIGLAVLTQQVLGGVHAYAKALGIGENGARRQLVEGGSGRPLPGTWLSLIGSGPHQGTTADLLLTSGFAVVTIGLLVLLGSPLGPAARRILTPVTAAGAAPLTVYTVHVLVVGVVTLAALGKPYSELSYVEYVSLDDPWYLSSPGFFAANVVLALLIGCLLAVLGRRGPLETAVTWAGRSAGRLGIGTRSAKLR
ncbi:hypothetical protein ACEXQB_004465 [Herbiconiux sp. P18]|uniref:hypothetical protein n=1 Tax=Herbiconiux liangxiaofengii TaxID=3342795 RepID=UPI0035B8DD23